MRRAIFLLMGGGDGVAGHGRSQTEFGNEGNPRGGDCLAPTGLELLSGPYPGRCPGLTCFAPLGLGNRLAVPYGGGDGVAGARAFPRRSRGTREPLQLKCALRAHRAGPAPATTEVSYRSCTWESEERRGVRPEADPPNEEKGCEKGGTGIFFGRGDVIAPRAVPR